MKKTLLKISTVAFISVLPVVTLAAGAATGEAFGTVNDIIKALGSMVSNAMPVVIGLAILGFFWGLVKYIFAGGEGGKDEAKTIMGWSLVALFVMFSVFGIIKMFQRTFGVANDNSVIIQTPQIEGLGR
jgi:hypothetical protein